MTDNTGAAGAGSNGRPPLPPLSRAAAFFDLDGTLTPIVATPEAVRITSDMLDALVRVRDLTAGATAVVSGRSLADLDRLLDPLRLPCAGLHGAQWRDAGGSAQSLALDRTPLEVLAARLTPLRERHAGIRLEDKGQSLAVHFRQAPEAGEAIRAVLDDGLRDAPAFALQAGKMVWEVKPRGASKGEAIRRFLQQPPFAGRIAVFFGDDVTDEAGFAVVNELGGVSVKVGEGDTTARVRLESPDAVLRCLRAWS